MKGRVLVGVDGSGPSEAATTWAAERAARLGLDLTLLHAVDGGKDGLVGGESVPRFSLEHAVTSSRRIPGVGAVKGLSVEGDPMAELIAASGDASIVVVGSHKTGFLRGRVFGSRSLRLVATASCPVAVIPEPSGRARHGVTVGVDGSEAGRRAVVFAAKEAVALGEDLTLIRGDEPLLPLGADVEVATGADRLLAAARDAVTGVAPEVRVLLRSVELSAAEALADASPTSILLVLAASTGGGATLGSTAHDVLMNLAGPTVFVPGG
ncbi:universal stress protein [Microbacterium sp. P07]|uniref:universal stress protein n=1 Tax=Microbacterium sp. P07 TaxID=3366952 RepID=UPI003746A40A